MTDTLLTPSNEFIDGKLVLDVNVTTNRYSVEDAGAIASVINYVKGNTGLVNVVQNIRILTETSSNSNVDLLVEPYRVTLAHAASWTKITTFDYSVDESDIFNVEYSVTAQLTGNNVYFRSGSFKILTSDTSSVLTDNFSEINSSGTSAIYFNSVYNGISGKTELWYTTTGNPAQTYILSTKTTRWKSF